MTNTKVDYTARVGRIMEWAQSERVCPICKAEECDCWQALAVAPAMLESPRPRREDSMKRQPCPVCKKAVAVRDCYGHLQAVHPAWLIAEAQADKANMERAWSTGGNGPNSEIGKRRRSA